MEYSLTKLVQAASQAQPSSLFTTKWEVSLTTKTLAWTWWCQVSRCSTHHTPTTLDKASKWISNLDSHSLIEACTRDSTVLKAVKAIRMPPIRSSKPLSTTTNSMFPTMLRDNSSSSYSNSSHPSGWTTKTTASMQTSSQWEVLVAAPTPSKWATHILASKPSMLQCNQILTKLRCSQWGSSMGAGRGLMSILLKMNLWCRLTSHPSTLI